jgi:hypothetical protein
MFAMSSEADNHTNRRSEPGRAEARPDSTRNRVAECLQRGLSRAETARELGISKATVSYHARRLGEEVDQRFSKRYDWAEIQRAHDAGMRALECCLHFGCSKASWSAAVDRGDLVPRSHLIPLGELLVRGRRTQRGHLKTRLVAAGLKEDRCELCGIDEWRGAPLSIQLHHVNGDGQDNRLENLELLCPNCHSQTDTYGGRNGHRRPERHLELVDLPPDDEEEPTGS